jgi:AcrR family transcriptional regulator
MTDRSVIFNVEFMMASMRGRRNVKAGRGAPRRRARAGGGFARSTVRQIEQAKGARANRGARRRDAILAAALEEFSAHGFEATRLEDIARRAGIAKGTIYLYFNDKETLFQELVRSEISPVVTALEHVAYIEAPIQAIAEQFIELFVREIVETRRSDVIRLVLSEGPRFPKLAEFYYREVITRALAAVRALLKRAIERGEIDAGVLLRFPQLLIAPGLVAILWNALFNRFEPLDARALLRSHFDFVFGKGRPA